jgi:hypothetical protein
MRGPCVSGPVSRAAAPVGATAGKDQMPAAPPSFLTLASDRLRRCIAEPPARLCARGRQIDTPSHSESPLSHTKQTLGVLSDRHKFEPSRACRSRVLIAKPFRVLPRLTAPRLDKLHSSNRRNSDPCSIAAQPAPSGVPGREYRGRGTPPFSASALPTPAAILDRPAPSRYPEPSRTFEVSDARLP